MASQPTVGRLMADHTEILATSQPSEAGIEPGDVVLIGGDMPMCASCLLRVETVKSWGVTGSVCGPNAAEYPLRLALENITTVFRERR